MRVHDAPSRRGWWRQRAASSTHTCAAALEFRSPAARASMAFCNAQCTGRTECSDPFFAGARSCVPNWGVGSVTVGRALALREQGAAQQGAREGEKMPEKKANGAHASHTFHKTTAVFHSNPAIFAPAEVTNCWMASSPLSP